MDSETFNLLISDLNMPKMDGLQVISIVRRKYPGIRVVVMTAVGDSQFRNRAYAMGVDLYVEKPCTSQEINQFLDCIESLVEQKDEKVGFRGIQSKSLTDILQLESLSQSSSILKITNGSLIGRIFFLNGQVIDADHDELTGEEAFQEMLSWNTGSFEVLPPDSTRERTIHVPVDTLLLECAHLIDEGQAENAGEVTGQGASGESPEGHLTGIVKMKGIEFALIGDNQSGETKESWGLENPEAMNQWARETLKSFSEFGDKMEFGVVNQVVGYGEQRHVGLKVHSDVDICIGFHRNLTKDDVSSKIQTIISKWGS
jgi:CheY-like chemotaxis protein